LEYIKSTFDIIISIKVESKINEYKKSLHQDNNAATEYEVLLQKLEASIRQHISYEHQFKIEYEKLLNKAEEIDLENKVLADHIEKQDDCGVYTTGSGRSVPVSTRAVLQSTSRPFQTAKQSKEPFRRNGLGKVCVVSGAPLLSNSNRQCRDKRKESASLS
jgi:hypothetical protein